MMMMTAAPPRERKKEQLLANDELRLYRIESASSGTARA